MPSTITKTAAALLLIGMASPVSSAFADDAQMHQFWLDQQQSPAGQAADPSTRVPDSGRASYQDENEQRTAAPATHHLKHRHHQTNG